MSSIPPILIWVVLGFLAYCLATSVAAVLAARAHFETARHDLIVESKKLRLEYLSTIDEKMAGVEDDSVIYEDDDTPIQAA